jgi:hypothetical protein
MRILEITCMDKRLAACNSFVAYIASYVLPHFAAVAAPFASSVCLNLYQVIICRLLQRRHGFDPRSVHVGFVVDGVALGQVSLPVIPFCHVLIFQPMPHTHILLVYSRRYVFSASNSAVMSKHLTPIPLSVRKFTLLLMNISSQR